MVEQQDPLAEIKARMKAAADTPERRERYFRIHGAMDLGWLVGEVERLRGRLRELEWINRCDGCDQGRCPVCGGHEGRRGHEPDCWLAKELADE